MYTDKKSSRLKRAAKTRCLIRSTGSVRLSVHRTPRHIYAQILSGDGALVMVSSSTVQAVNRQKLKGTGNIAAAQLIGKDIAEKALAAGLVNVSFDRSGFKYHGRIRALADAAREAGLQF